MVTKYSHMYFRNSCYIQPLTIYLHVEMDLHEMILLLFVISYKTDVTNLIMIQQNNLFVVCNLLVIL